MCTIGTLNVFFWCAPFGYLYFVIFLSWHDLLHHFHRVLVGFEPTTFRTWVEFTNHLELEFAINTFTRVSFPEDIIRHFRAAGQSFGNGCRMRFRTEINLIQLYNWNLKTVNLLPIWSNENLFWYIKIFWTNKDLKRYNILMVTIL